MKKRLIVTAALVFSVFNGCSSVSSVFDASTSDDNSNRPIHNPFGDFYSNGSKNDGGQDVILRSKKGDQSVEVQVPQNGDDSNFVIPVSPSFKDPTVGADRDPATTDAYKDVPSTESDREITSTFPADAAPEDQKKRQDIESGLGLVASKDATPERDSSYLAAVDHIKQLYKQGRYEAALMSNDELISQYPTAWRAYEMKGTLLDRLGKTDLALRAWQQALRLNPSDESLRHFVERKQKKVSSSP